MLYIETTARIAHIVAAIVLAGGAIFVRYILMPSAETIAPAEHEKLKHEVARRWRIIIAIGIALLIFSGFYNYLALQAPRHRGDGFYHMWMGIKILLAFVVFFLASALAGRSPKLEGIRRNSKMWLTLTVSLALLIVAIGGVLKVRGVPAVKPAPEAPIIADPAI